MSIEAIIFMVCIFVVCGGGFAYSLYLASKQK